MRAVVQRVREASVSVDGAVVGSCQRGCLILLGVAPADGEAEARQLWDKIYHLRIFGDDTGKTNLSLADIKGEVLIVSQFTLFADCRKGRRPSFTKAAGPKLANRLYEYFCTLAEQSLEDRGVSHVGRGIFGASMQVSLVNDGPFTICLDTAELARPRR